MLAGILAGIVATSHDSVEDWGLLTSYAVAIHSYTGYAAAELMGSRSVIATDLIDLIGSAMQLVEDEAFRVARNAAEKGE